MSYNRIKKYAVPVTIASSGTTKTSGVVPINGLLRGIVVDAPDLDDSDTYTVTLIDEEGATIQTFATLAENSVVAKYIDANNNYFNQPLHNPQVTITASGAQAAARDFVINIYYES